MSPPNLAESVRGRLQHRARTQGEDFQFVLTRYANERLLYRLGNSCHANNFVLKGAALFAVWTGKPHRATRDLDLLGFGPSDEPTVEAVFREVLASPTADDAVQFDLTTLSVRPIREGQAYAGVRVELIARVTTAKVNLQVDIGFGDAITPAAELVDFPVLLDFPAPRLRAYPRETVVAEKLEAMVQLGLANSRMKDFYDLALLARDFNFDGRILAEALRATFERRKTVIATEPPVALTSIFAEDPSKQTQWRGFVRKAGVQDAATLAETVLAVATFVKAPLEAARTGARFVRRWSMGGPWG
jgi:predicted nucleotidyltransferase component of viral defense system